MSLREKPFALLVDDNDATCTLITAILAPHFSTVVATDGDEAIEQLKTRTYSVILLDLRMPHRDGYDVLEFLKRETPDTVRRVVVVTAALTDNEVQRARAFGIFDIVRKPFEVEHLLETVQKCACGGEDKGFDFLLSSPAVLLLVADLLKLRLM
jgi:CheY-like chemotaxis protein